MKKPVRTGKVRSGRLAGAFALALMVGGQSVAYAEHGQTGTVGLETAAASEGAEEKPIPTGVSGTPHAGSSSVRRPCSPTCRSSR